MALSVAVRKKRNKSVTEMLKRECNISVKIVNKQEAIKRGSWFIATEKTEGELKLIYK